MPEIATRPVAPPLLPECRVYPAPAPELKMRLPFGLNIKAIQDSFVRYADADDAVMSFIAQIQPALSPFMSVLVLAAIAKSLIDFTTAVKDAVSSLSVDPIIEAIKKIAVLLPRLLEFIPPLNYIPPIIDITMLVITLLQTAINALLTVLETEILRQAFQTALEQNPLLNQYSACLDAAEQAQKNGFASSIRAAAPVLCILSQLLDLIDFKPIKDYIEPLRDAVRALAGVTANNVNPALAELLRDVQELLGEIRVILEPFSGSPKETCG